MYEIKQSTAVTVPFFVHDASGDAVTGLSDGSFTKRISKNGASFGAMTVTITELENGWYSIPLSTSHSDTLGLLTVVFTNAGAKQVNLQWRVEAKLIDDLQDITTAQVNTECDTALTDYDGPTDAEMNARTLVAASYFDPAADAVANVTLVATTTTNTDMVGTNNALLAASAPTNFGDLTITASTGLVTVGTNNDKAGYSISGTITTLDGLNNFNPSSEAVANVTLVATTTTNSDMRGTNSANTVAPDNTGIAAIQAKTDLITFTVANQVDANIQSVNEVTVTGTGSSGDEWGP